MSGWGRGREKETPPRSVLFCSWVFFMRSREDVLFNFLSQVLLIPNGCTLRESPVGSIMWEVQPWFAIADVTRQQTRRFCHAAVKKVETDFIFEDIRFRGFKFWRLTRTATCRRSELPMKKSVFWRPNNAMTWIQLRVGSIASLRSSPELGEERHERAAEIEPNWERQSQSAAMEIAYYTLRITSHSFYWTLLEEKIDSQRLPTQVSSSWRWSPLQTLFQDHRFLFEKYRAYRRFQINSTRAEHHRATRTRNLLLSLKRWLPKVAPLTVTPPSGKEP